MALIIYHPDENGRVKQEIVTPEKAHQVWQVMNGVIEGTEAQQDFCALVAVVKLNWREAPDDYIKHYQDAIMTMEVMQWMRDRQGDYTRPDLARPSDKVFAKKWRLTQNGISTTTARVISHRLNVKRRK